MLTADQSRSSPLGYMVSFDSDYMQACFAISGWDSCTSDHPADLESRIRAYRSQAPCRLAQKRPVQPLPPARVLEFLSNIGIDCLCCGDISHSSLRIPVFHFCKPLSIKGKGVFGIKSKHGIKISRRTVIVLLFAVSNGAIIEKCRDIAVQPNCLMVVRDSTVVLAFQPINYAAIVVCVGEARIKKNRLIIIL